MTRAEKITFLMQAAEGHIDPSCMLDYVDPRQVNWSEVTDDKLIKAVFKFNEISIRAQMGAQVGISNVEVQIATDSYTQKIYAVMQNKLFSRHGNE